MAGARSAGVWKAFLLSYALPIIGGLIVYLRGKRNKKLRNICLTLSILNPFIVQLGIGFLIGFYSAVFLPLEAEIPDWILYGVGLVSMISVAFLLTMLFEDNIYRHFIPVWYLSILGAIYSYNAYRRNKPLRKDVLCFLVGQIAVLIAMYPFMGALLYLLFAPYLEEPALI